MSDERDEHLLEVIQRYIDRHGYAPTVRDLRQLIGWSLATTHNHLNRLRRAGAVTWVPGQARTLRVLRRN